MLTILLGQHLEARGARLESLLAAERAAGSDIAFYTDVNFNPEEIIFSVNSVTLFGKKSVFVMTGIYDNTDLRLDLEKMITVLAESEALFILCEKSLLTPFVKKATAAKATIEKFEDTKAQKKELFNVFALTDVYSDRKRSMAWATYRAAVSAGLDAYELHGKLFWVTKNMILVKKTANAAEAGLHPFVYGKTKKAAEKFTIEELQKNLVELTKLSHDNMFGGVNLETSLESFLLRSLQ